MVAEKMVGARDDPVIDGDVFLLGQFGGQFLDRADWHHLVFVPMQDKTRGRTRSEEREVVNAGRRRDRDKTVDLGPPHHQLHADPGAERKSGDPTAARVGIVALHPIESRGGVAELALAIVELSLRSTDAAKIETQGGKSTLDEGLVQGIRDAVVHGAAVLRVGMQQQGDRRTGFRMMITAFEAAVGTVEYHFRHNVP